MKTKAVANFGANNVSVLLNCTTVGIADFSNKQETTIYPNPANNRVQVISGNNKLILISIYDMLGKEMIRTKEKEIDVSNLQEGIYFARVKTSEGILSKKIIIQR